MRTGKLVWRTFTAPGDPSLGFESKALEDCRKNLHGSGGLRAGRHAMDIDRLRTLN